MAIGVSWRKAKLIEAKMASQWHGIIGVASMAA
jgi:hypothetical protein